MMQGPIVNKWSCPHEWEDGSDPQFLEVSPQEDAIDLSCSDSEFVTIRNPKQFSQFIQALMMAATQIGWLDGETPHD